MAQRFGRYVLWGEIAVGGMATVHLARVASPTGFKKIVAVKRLHRGFAGDPEFSSALLEEARLAVRIAHVNVVPMLDVVEADGETFLVMEYVHGETLARLSRAAEGRDERAPLGVVVSIVAGMLRGLHAAHEALGEDGRPLGLVHRDVSPQNVIVGVDGTARMLDFGIAKAAGRGRITREGRVKGKLAYMAPEQIHGDRLDRQTDIYGASVVLWEAVTGERLFSADSEAALEAKVLNHEVRPPSEVVSGVPTALNRVVLRGLARQAELRFATALEMAAALEESVLPASAAVVGDWVRSLASDALEERAQRLREAETGEAPPPSPKAAPRIRRYARVGGAALAIGLLATPLVQWYRSSSVAKPVAPGLRTSAVAPNEAALEEPAQAPVVIAGQPPSAAPLFDRGIELPSSSGPIESVSVRATSPRPSVSRPAPPASNASETVSTARSECNPPYVADDAGHLRFKRECLR